MPLPVTYGASSASSAASTAGTGYADVVLPAREVDDVLAGEGEGRDAVADLFLGSRGLAHHRADRFELGLHVGREGRDVCVNGSNPAMAPRSVLRLGCWLPAGRPRHCRATGRRRTVSRHTFTIGIAAPVDVVFDLWTNLERMREWTGGVTKVTGPTGPMDRVGTRYSVWFGGMESRTEVIDAERPKRFGTRREPDPARHEHHLVRTGRHRHDPDPGVRDRGPRRRVHGPDFRPRVVQGQLRGELEAFRRIAETEAARGKST